jgi:hypothetical protein
MPSSLAAALAASKKGGPAAVDTSVKSEDEYPSSRPSSLQQRNQKKDVSRPSSLQQHNQKKDGVKRDEKETATKGPRGKIKKHDGTSNNDHVKDGNIKDPIQREKTLPTEGGGDPDDEGGAKSTTKSAKQKGAKASPPAKNYDLSTGQIVFVCDIPSDGDDDDGDCKDCADDYDGARPTKPAKRRGRKNRGKAPTSSVKISDNSPGEIVFVCDIPSDSDGDGDYRDGGDGNFDDDDRGDVADEGGECEIEVDDLDFNVVMTMEGCQKNTARNRGKGDRGKGGSRDDRSSQGPPFAGRGGDRGALMHGTPGRDNNSKCGGINLRRGNNKSLGDGGKNRHIPNLPVNPGAMPTPWSIRAQATKNNNDLGISKQGADASRGRNLGSGNTTTAKVDRSTGGHIANPPANPSSTPTPWSARAEAMKNNDACDKSTRKQSRDNDARAGLHPRNHCPTGGTSSRERISSGAPHPNPTIASANTVIESGYGKEPAASSAIKLESTAIKGRWADEDSDDE